ncbi:hypothetical protein TNCV_65301 [Trichonephila clavipes]|nr:hypothetical protein TNCV_65301 [Trichonephila clavipes]
MESTMDINLDNQLTTGNEITSEQQPNGNEMDQSLPPSPGISLPGTPLLTNCQRRHQLAQDIKYYTITMENLKFNIKSRRINGLLDESSHIMKEHHQRLANYSSLHQITLNLSNKFNGLENSVPTIDPVEGTSTSTAVTKVLVNKNPSANKNTNQTTDTTKKLPPPVMLKITLNFREQMKTITDYMPKLRSKMTGEYFK